MPIDIRVEDADLVGFSDPAKDSVKKAGEEFIKRVIDEANRLESAHNTNGGLAEVTAPMVQNAAVIQRHAIGTKKSPWYIKGLRVTSGVVSMVVGFMYDDVKLQNGIYMAVFVGLMTVAIGTIIASAVKE